MIAADHAVRPFAAKCRYPGKDDFYLGTVVLAMDAKQHEIDAALLKLWGDLSPHPPPEMVAVPGAVFFVPDGDQA